MFIKLAKKISEAKIQALCMASAGLLACALSGTAQALPLKHSGQFYFFGDSFTDSGFNNFFPGRPAGKAPTFTTYGGHIWSQYLAHDLKGYPYPDYNNPPAVDKITNNTTPLSPHQGPAPVFPNLTGIDYAAGNSTTNAGGFVLAWAPSLHAQIENFLTTPCIEVDPDDVVFIWAGTYDLLAALTSSPNPTELDLLKAADTATRNIAKEVVLLTTKGYKNVVVVNLPNLGYTPLINGIAAQTQNPDLPGSIQTLTFTFNSMLNQRLGEVIASYGTHLLYVDAYDLLDNVVTAIKAEKPYIFNGKPFIFSNYQTPSCGAVTSIRCPAGTPKDYVYADTLNFTGRFHRLLARVVEHQLKGWL